MVSASSLKEAKLSRMYRGAIIHQLRQGASKRTFMGELWTDIKHQTSAYKVEAHCVSPKLKDSFRPQGHYIRRISSLNFKLRVVQ